MNHKYAVALVAACLAAAAAANAQDAAAVGTQAPLRLSLRQAAAIAIAPDGNARLRLAAELVRQAQGQSGQARAALLPNVDASVGQQSQTRNLESYGIGLNVPTNPFFSFPKFVGPFNTFDARVSARQSVFDWSAIRRFQAARAGVGTAEAEQAGAQDQVLSEVARAYLASLRSEAAADTAAANVDLARALLSLAENQKAAGGGTGVEVTRARVQLANEEQRLIVARNERTRARLLLLRILGLGLDTAFELSDEMSLTPVQVLPLSETLALALESRADWLAQRRRLETTRLNHSAVRSERLPSVGVFGDYGAIGLAADDSLPTRTYGVTVRVPLFDGGGRDARRAQSASQLRQEEIRTEDLRDQIELEVRVALDNLASAEEQVQTAEKGLSLAENELAQARRRYEAGVSFGLEVTDAQTRLQRARDNRISALYNYNLARIQLAAASGTIRQIVQ
jgi:outer membrane protein